MEMCAAAEREKKGHGNVKNVPQVYFCEGWGAK